MTTSRKNDSGSTKVSIREKASFSFASLLFQMRRRSGRLPFDQGYPLSEHKELIKVEDPKGLILAKGQKIQILDPKTGVLTDIKDNHPMGFSTKKTKNSYTPYEGYQIKTGDVVVITIPEGKKNKRSTTIDGKTDNKNLRIRFIEHIPPQISGTTEIKGAILNTHGINSNLSISSERAKHSEVLRHNAATPQNQQMFVSYDPPGYGLSGAAKSSMAKNEGHRLEELMKGSMNLMAIYTSAKAKEASKKQDIGLSIHTHSMSTGVATGLLADVFDPNQERKSYCGVGVPTKDSLKITSLSIDSPYTSFENVVKDTTKGLMPGKLYEGFGLPDLDNVKNVEKLAVHAPKGFKIDIEQPRATGGELSALVGKGDGIMRHSYAEKIAAAAFRGIEKNPDYDDKKGAVTLYLINEATHHGKTAQRFGTTSKLEVGEEIQSHGKITSSLGLKHSHPTEKLVLKGGLEKTSEYSEIYKDRFDEALKTSQDHKYTSAYAQRLQRLLVSNEVSQDTLTVRSHESVMLQQLNRPLNEKYQKTVETNIAKYDKVAKKVEESIKKRIETQNLRDSATKIASSALGYVRFDEAPVPRIRVPSSRRASILRAANHT